MIFDSNMVASSINSSGSIKFNSTSILVALCKTFIVFFVSVLLCLLEKEGVNDGDCLKFFMKLPFFIIFLFEGLSLILHCLSFSYRNFFKNCNFF